MTARSYRVGIDIGGTFTDIVVLGADGTVHTRKVSSSPEDQARVIVDSLRQILVEADLAASDIVEILHGTTVASNAILEHTGARTGLITTRGFRDVLEIRRLRMPQLYDLEWQKPPALVERRLRLEVDERVNARGMVVVPLDEVQVEAVVDRLVADGVETIAVCLINAYANPIHEQAIKTIARRLAPHVPVCISAEVLPEIREYERTSTTVINCYVMPLVQAYLEALTIGLHAIGVKVPLLIMQSSGGVLTAEAAGRLPVHIIESGPAAGVIGARALARRMALSKVLTFDMGGTTAKASIVEGGEATRAAEYQVGGGIMLGSRLLTGAGYLIRVPAIDLAEVGAGGGSIVWIDAGGSLQIGPRSAGAVPGPLCYDLGGFDPTVTDANVILGYSNPHQLAGGAVRLNADRARALFEERIARPLGLSLADAAYGAHLIAASNMMRAIRAVSSERGRDPREHTLVAFGGNGPLFAAGMAEALGVRRIVVPPAPGLFSAFGLLDAELEHHYVRSWRRSTRGLDLHELNQLWDGLESDALAQLAAAGFSGAAARLRRSADLCYAGQSFELTVPVPAGTLDAATLLAVEDAFGAEHERTYGHRAGRDEPIEIVSLRLSAHGVSHQPRSAAGSLLPDHRIARPAGEPCARDAYFGREAGWIRVPILARADLARPHAGPCIIEEYDSTCVVPPRVTASLDEYGNIALDL